MLSLSQFEDARERLKDVIKETKLIHSPTFSEESGNEVYIKPENLQITGAFKIRGAYNRISLLDEDSKKRGLIASSAGNHAQGVAYAAQKLGVEATIVMPKPTPLIKVEATRKYGANVVLAGEVYDEAYKEAKRLQELYKYEFIHPFNDDHVIIGQGTIALEILEELPDADILMVAIGGGGLAAGIAHCAKLINPNIKIIGVEPEGAQCMNEALKAGKVVELPKVSTIADGAAVKVAGERTFELLNGVIDEIVTVSDYELMDAFLVLLERHKLIAENAGILSLAGLQKIKEKGKKIVSVISGGNIDVLTISSMITKGLVSRGRIFSFSVDLTDKPGELLQVSKILAEQNANVIKLNHNQFKNLERFSNVELEVTVETNGEKHIKAITETLNSRGYEIIRLY